MKRAARMHPGLSYLTSRFGSVSALPVAVILFSVELQRHWDVGTKWLYLVCLVIAALTWLGVLLEKIEGELLGTEIVDLTILIFLAGCIALGWGIKDFAAIESAKKLLFWSPLICIWWATRFKDRPVRLLTSMATLYIGLFIIHADDSSTIIEHVFLSGLAASLVWFTVAELSPRDDLYALSEAGINGTRDAVTFLPGPKVFEDQLAMSMAVADRFRVPSSLLVCRVEGLMELTARIGEQAANEIIKTFAWKISEQIRTADSICRWEGGKFIVLLPHTDLEGGKKIVERLRHASESIALPEGVRMPVRIGIYQHHYGDDPMVTFSMAEAAMQDDQPLAPNQG